MWRRSKRRDMADVNVYTASRLVDMARSLGTLARSCEDELDENRGLTREDALGAMQMSAAMVCGGCSRCNLYSDSGKEDSYYLYYLLRDYEQKGQVEFEDMPRFFLETCRRREDYLSQLNRNLGRATMNLEWKNRFLESRDTVMVQGSCFYIGGVCPPDGTGIGYYWSKRRGSKANLSAASHVGGESAFVGA